MLAAVSIVDVVGISVRCRRWRRRSISDKVSFRLARPNGAGKTTLISRWLVWRVLIPEPSRSWGMT